MSDLVKVAMLARRLEQSKDVYSEAMLDVIEKGFSALASVDPKAALLVIEQLNLQKEIIENQAKEHEEFFANLEPENP